MKICPKCGGKRFIVTAHVAENWLVDEEGTFLEATQRGVDVVHYPDDNDVWESPLYTLDCFIRTALKTADYIQ